MNKNDLEYICTNLSNLLGTPVRIYQDNKSIFFYYMADFPKDPFILSQDELLTKEDKISFITTDDFFCYAYINYLEYKAIFGPFRQVKPEDMLINKIGLLLNLTKEEMETFNASFKSINSNSLEVVLKTLSLLYFTLTNEKVSTSDILIDNNQTKAFNQEINKQIMNQEFMDINDFTSRTNNTHVIEKELCRMVEYGEIDNLKAWIKNIPVVRSGILSTDSIRHTKNIFIATTTLVSRAAIKGNMDPDEALSLSDLYIQKMELLKTSTEILTLQSNMIIDYTERVAKINSKKDASALLISFNKYVLSHLSDAIKVEDICKELYISKSVLFDKIKKETNMTVSNYILYLKINEGKFLLRNTNQSIASISYYLGFSTQSHFDHAFKKITNTTPKNYKLHNK